jgi:hypothetical protein
VIDLPAAPGQYWLEYMRWQAQQRKVRIKACQEGCEQIDLAR